MHERMLKSLRARPTREKKTNSKPFISTSGTVILVFASLQHAQPRILRTRDYFQYVYPT